MDCRRIPRRRRERITKRERRALWQLTRPGRLLVEYARGRWYVTYPGRRASKLVRGVAPRLIELGLVQVTGEVWRRSFVISPRGRLAEYVGFALIPEED